MNLNNFFQSKGFKIATWIVAVLIILLLVLWIGISMGYKKAQFSYRWGENYHLNFGGPRGGFLFSIRNNLDGEFIASHGIVGQIIKIDGNTIVMEDSRDNTEKNLVVSDNTLIRRGQETIKVSDLKVDNRIVIIGSPNEQGQIDAKLIRIFPENMMQDGRLPYKPRPFPFF